MWWSLTSASEFVFNSSLIIAQLLDGVLGSGIDYFALKGCRLRDLEDKQQVLLLSLFIKFLHINFFPKVGAFL